MKHGKSLFVLALSLPTLFSCGNKPAPKPEIVYYDITFNANGGEIISGETSIRVAAGTTFEQCEKPIAKLDEKAFQYWSFDQEGTRAVGETFRIDNNYDLFANYYTEGTLHFKQPEDSSIVCYGSTGISYADAQGTVNVTSSNESILTAELDTDRSCVYLDAVSGNIQGESTITISDGVSSDSIVIGVHYPTSAQEAGEAMDFAAGRKINDVTLTFNYNNQDSLNVFYNDRMETTYSVGARGLEWRNGYGKTNRLQFVPSTTMATQSKDISQPPYSGYYYENLKNVAYELRHSKIQRRTDNHFAIDDAKKRLVIHNSETLFFALERGFRPEFVASEIAVPNSVANRAYQVYQKAREACAEAFGTETTDNLTKVRQLYEWLLDNTHYDHWIADDPVEVDDFTDWTSYFPEGVFLNEGIAVCAGFAKSLSIMGGIEGLPIICCKGSAPVGGHAWNYYQHSDGKYYLVCPTWSHIDNEADQFLDYNYSAVSYQPFMAESKYFYDSKFIECANYYYNEIEHNVEAAKAYAKPYAEQVDFDDLCFSDVIKSDSPLVDDIYTTDIFDMTHNYDYHLDSEAEADALVAAIEDLNLAEDFSVDISYFNDCGSVTQHFIDELATLPNVKAVNYLIEYTLTHTEILVKF